MNGERCKKIFNLNSYQDKKVVTGILVTTLENEVAVSKFRGEESNTLPTPSHGEYM